MGEHGFAGALGSGWVKMLNCLVFVGCVLDVVLLLFWLVPSELTVIGCEEVFLLPVPLVSMVDTISYCFGAHPYL